MGKEAEKEVQEEEVQAIQEDSEVSGVIITEAIIPEGGIKTKMYCRKCSSKSNKAGVSMKNDIKERTYTCSKCNHKVKWDKNALN
jgi:predicted SprT family Zn-dependent metalloprotease